MVSLNPAALCGAIACADSCGSASLSSGFGDVVASENRDGLYAEELREISAERCAVPGPDSERCCAVLRGKKENVPKKKASLSRTGLRWYLHPLPSACGYQKQAAQGPECWRETALDPSEWAGSRGPWTGRVATIANLSRWDGPNCARGPPSRLNLPMIRLTFEKLKQSTRCRSPAGDFMSKLCSMLQQFVIAPPV